CELRVQNFARFVKQQEAALAAARAEVEHVKKQVSYNQKLRDLALATARQNFSYRTVDLENRRKALAIFTNLTPTRPPSDLDHFRAPSDYYAAEFARSEAERELERAKVALPVGALRDDAHVARATNDVKRAEVNLASALYDKGRLVVRSPGAGAVTFGSP